MGAFFFTSQGGKRLPKFKPNETKLLICPRVPITLSYLNTGAMSFWVSVSVVLSPVSGAG